jgi:uncharacterized protein (TIRG00374 family)
VPVSLIGYLGNTVLPARLGDAAMAVLVGRRERIPIAGAIGSVVLLRVLDTLVLAALVFPAAIITGLPTGFVQAAGLAAAVAVSTLLVAQTRLPAAAVGFAMSRIHWAPADMLLDHGLRFLEAMRVMGRWRSFAVAIGMSIAIWTLEAGIYWLASESLGVGLVPAAALLVAAVTILGTAIPSAPGYVGTFELAASTVARALGVEPSTALAYAILIHALTAIPLALGGVAAMAWLGLGVGTLRRSASEAIAEPAAVDRSRP